MKVPDVVHALRMALAGTPDDAFAAAGSPWYLTLFGRDSIWAVVRLAPSSAVGALAVSGLTVNGAPFAVAVDRHGEVLSVECDPSLQVRVRSADRF